MKTVSTTNARKHMASLLKLVREGGVVAIGRRNDLEALLIKFPQQYNPKLNDITNINTYSASFDFLLDEPDLYSIDDLEEQYA